MIDYSGVLLSQDDEKEELRPFDEGDDDPRISDPVSDNLYDWLPV